ncbi:MAG: Tol-Pal system beta propeller repeat protein TolB [Candidatus Nitrospinota bacterium M3_3B_026]
MKDRTGRAPALAALVLAFVLASPPAAPAQSDVYLSTKRTESKRIEVAVPEFSGEGKDAEGLGREAAETVNHDLDFSGYFKPNDNYGFMREARKRDERKGEIDFKEWRTLASNFLVKGAISFRESGALAVEIKVYDLQAKALFFSKRYIGPRKLFRQIVHQFSNDFLERLTGERGVARTKIAFVSRVMGRKELFIMDYDGFNPRPITSDRSIVLLPDWNPKSNLILFTTYRYRNPDLYAIDLKAGLRYPISRRIGVNTTGEWSPDGKKVAFSLSRKGNSDIYICDADGSNVRKITRWRSIETSPSWSPDGKRIAFTSDMSGSPQIYTMNIDGTGRKRLTFKGGYNDGAAWSPKGAHIAYTSLLDGKFNIAVINVRESSDTRQLTSGAGTNEAPSWSPDGRNIAFSSNRAGSRQIYIMKADGSGQRRITSLQGGGYTPAWGPDLSSGDGG